ncbi:MAG: methyl-accepting chemotaxis protein [Spirochaetes bacterium]|nr:methyl-accepting chemotaxis protein [Spirochaetota bacterium]
MPKPPVFRRKYWIQPAYQGRTILAVFLALASALAVAGVAVVLLSSRELSDSVYSRLQGMKDAREAFTPLVAKVGAATLALASVAIAVWFLFYTHRIAGPLFRLKRTLAELRAGDLRVRVQLRRRDDLKDLADGLNDVIIDYSSRVGELQREHAAIAKLAAKKKPAAKDLDEIRKRLDALGEKLAFFKR